MRTGTSARRGSIVLSPQSISASNSSSVPIVAIDPGSGELEATVDASGLLSEAQQADADVLNGIAALPDDEFLMTGKLWPEALVVRFVPVEATS